MEQITKYWVEAMIAVSGTNVLERRVMALEKAVEKLRLEKKQKKQKKQKRRSNGNDWCK